METIHYTTTVRTPQAKDNVVEFTRYQNPSPPPRHAAISAAAPLKPLPRQQGLLQRAKQLSSLLEVSLCGTLFLLSCVLLVKCILL